MSLRRTVVLALAVATLAVALASTAAPAAAVPTPEQTAEERAAVARAVERYEAAQAEAAAIDARIAKATSALDTAVAEEEACQARLSARAVSMYRSDNAGPLSLLLGASSIQELAERLEILQRLAQQDADTIRELKAARAEAKRSAEGLMVIQAEQAEALDALAAEVSTAKETLAASEAALREYEAKKAAAAAAAAAAARARNQVNQTLTGSGGWKTAIASHYSPDFTGRGASGETIGPYSMIVAHKTLPFGTLVEFEYEGKRAVARVADRGPYTPGRTFDLGPGVVRVLGFSGVHQVRYRIVGQ